MSSQSSERLRGSFTPLLTPFANGELDLDTYRICVNRHIEAGGHGVVVNGTTAEPSTLTVHERNLLVTAAVATAAGRCPVVAATGSQSHAETCSLTDHATQAGADALLIVTPYYIRPPDRGLIEYFVDVAKRTPLPVLIYNIPSRTASAVTVETICAIRKLAPNVVGLKQAANDLTLVTECLARFGHDFRIFAGLEGLSFPMMAIGACGVMNAVGNIAPAKVAQLCDATLSAAVQTARRLHFELFELNQAVFFDTNPIPIKYMATRLGLLPCNEHRLPLLPATSELAKRLDAVLRRAGMLE